MITTKVYVLEWDAWSFEGVFREEASALSGIHYLETVKEYVVNGKIKNNQLFIISDGQGDWNGIFATKEEADVRKQSYGNNIYEEYKVREIELY